MGTATYSLERVKTFFKSVSYFTTRYEENYDHKDYLDGWRGIAISLVLVHHFYFLEYPKIGRLGVDIFFVLSGLLMSRILFVKKTPLSIFYSRRISRILPVFILFTVVMFLMAWFCNIDFSLKELYSTLFFLRTYIPQEPHIWVSQVPIGHLWSLNIEEHFYILLSLVTLLPFSKKKGFLLIVLAFVSIGMVIYYLRHSAYAPTNFILRTECASTCLFLSSGYFLLKGSFSKYVKPWMPPITFALAIVCYTNFTPWYSSWLIAPFLLAFTVNHIEESSDYFVKSLSIRPLQTMGVWSYSIYLWQQPFNLHQNKFPCCVAFILAMIVGVISYCFYEKPVRNWLNSYVWGSREKEQYETALQ